MDAASAGPGDEANPDSSYREAARRHGETVAEMEAEARRVEAGRLTTFVVGAVLGLLWNDLPVDPVFPIVGAVLFLSAFAVLVLRHRRLQRRLRRERAAHTLARVGLMRLGRQWPELHAAL
ncbi:MAG: hypothetical protein R3253_09665, partial [Longimicrobiales bacterium]|nr:hypothetical protein [Longimicrobiales bacterium]